MRDTAPQQAEIAVFQCETPVELCWNYCWELAALQNADFVSQRHKLGAVRTYVI